MRKLGLYVLLVVAGASAGCLTNESGGTADQSGFVSPAPGSTNSAPSISGTPPTSVMVTNSYAFTPTANDPDGDVLVFSIEGLPSWASFDPDTGRLTGTPMGGDEATYRNITISVSDGANSNSLAPFGIEVLPFGSTEPPSNSPPTISGTPPSSVTVNTPYSFTPTGDDPDGDRLTFSVQGLPTWAVFDTSTGRLSGTPTAGDENVYRNITIRVSDGVDSASLGPFTIEVIPAATGTGSATLSWTAPTENEDGTPLTDLAGFRLYWGTSPGNYPNSVRIDNSTVTTYTVDGLAPGTYEFVATAVNQAGVESSFSSPATKSIP